MKQAKGVVYPFLGSMPCGFAAVPPKTPLTCRRKKYLPKKKNRAPCRKAYTFSSARCFFICKGENPQWKSVSLTVMRFCMPHT